MGIERTSGLPMPPSAHDPGERNIAIERQTDPISPHQQGGGPTTYVQPCQMLSKDLLGSAAPIHLDPIGTEGHPSGQPALSLSHNLLEASSFKLGNFNTESMSSTNELQFFPSRQ